jgi:hypothetical protein
LKAGCEDITRGFATVGEPNVAVCLLPGTEIAFDQNVECEPSFGIGILPNKKIEQRLARFRQINMDNAVTHHDALEFPHGQVVLLTRLCAGQRATMLQLPIAAHPASAEEAVKREIREPSLLVFFERFFSKQHGVANKSRLLINTTDGAPCYRQ